MRECIPISHFYFSVTLEADPDVVWRIITEAIKIEQEFLTGNLPRILYIAYWTLKLSYSAHVILTEASAREGRVTEVEIGQSARCRIIWCASGDLLYQPTREQC